MPITYYTITGIEPKISHPCHVQNPSVNLEPNRIQFACLGKGARGEHSYGFRIDLFESINTQVCIHTNAIRLGMVGTLFSIYFPSLRRVRSKCPTAGSM